MKIKRVELIVGDIRSAISAAMLVENKCNFLQNLEPFVLKGIFGTCELGQRIDFHNVSKYIEDNYKFIRFTDKVVERIISKIPNPCIEHRNNQGYFLIKDLSSVIDSMNNKEDIIKMSINKIDDQLKLYSKNINKKLDINELFDFLEDNGHNLINDKTKILKNKNIYGSFIFDSQDEEYFQDILNIYTGILLKNYYYFQNDDDQNISKFKGTELYLDTPILLRYLGLKDEAENKQMKDLIKSLIGVKLCVFQHVYEELHASIAGYRHAIDTRGFSTRPLEYFQNKAPKEIQYYLDYLIEILDDANIEVKKTPKLNLDENQVYQDHYVFLEKQYENELDEYYLNENLGEDIKNKNALDVDSKSIISIYRLRNNCIASKIEDVNALFLTTNSSLYKALNITLQHSNKPLKVPYIITDEYLATFCWLKYPNCNDAIKKNLILNSFSCATTPSKVFLDAAISKIESFEKDGVSANEVSYYRQQHGLIKHIYKESGGDSSKLSYEYVREQATIYAKQLNKNIESEFKKQIQDNNLENQLAIKKKEAEYLVAQQKIEEESAKNRANRKEIDDLKAQLESQNKDKNDRILRARSKINTKYDNIQKKLKPTSRVITIISIIVASIVAFYNEESLIAIIIVDVAVFAVGTFIYKMLCSLLASRRIKELDKIE